MLDGIQVLHGYEPEILRPAVDSPWSRFLQSGIEIRSPFANHLRATSQDLLSDGANGSLASESSACR